MERPKSESPLSPYMIAALTAGAILVAVLVVDRLEQQRYDKVREARIIRSLSNARARLEAALNERLSLTRGLRAYVSTHPNISVPEFNHLASVLLSQQGTAGIRSVQLAKDTVVSHVYPVKGNKEAIGLDLLNVPEQSAAVRRALDSRATVLAGPVKLVQGGTAFIGRTPIYLTSPGEPPQQRRLLGPRHDSDRRSSIFSDAGIVEKCSKIFSTRCGEETERARKVKSFSVNRLSLIHIPRFSTLRFPAAHGSWRPFLCPVFCRLRRTCGCCEPAADCSPSPPGALAFFATLYNRRRTQERLRETSRQAEAKFEALAENAQDPIVSADSLATSSISTKRLNVSLDMRRVKCWANR